MKEIILLDTETTGNNIEKDRVVQLSWIRVTEDGTKILQKENNYANPGIPMSIESMMVHHITPDDIDGLKPINESPAYKHLERYNNMDNFIVMHNAEFDLAMLANEGFENRMTTIDTLNVSKHLYPEEPYHKLMYFYYLWKLYKNDLSDENVDISYLAAHDAFSDTIYLWQVFSKMLIDHSLDEMVKLTNTFCPMRYFTFGKYSKYKKKNPPTIAEVAKSDPGYIKFCLKMDNRGEYFIKTMKYYLDESNRDDLPF